MYEDRNAFPGDIEARPCEKGGVLGFGGLTSLGSLCIRPSMVQRTNEASSLEVPTYVSEGKG